MSINITYYFNNYVKLLFRNLSRRPTYYKISKEGVR